MRSVLFHTEAAFASLGGNVVVLDVGDICSRRARLEMLNELLEYFLAALCFALDLKMVNAASTEMVPGNGDGAYSAVGRVRYVSGQSDIAGLLLRMRSCELLLEWRRRCWEE